MVFTALARRATDRTALAMFMMVIATREKLRRPPNRVLSRPTSGLRARCQRTDGTLQSSVFARCVLNDYEARREYH
jgi:hypothetical protein